MFSKIVLVFWIYKLISGVAINKIVRYFPDCKVLCISTFGVVRWFCGSRSTPGMDGRLWNYQVDGDSLGVEGFFGRILDVWDMGTCLLPILVGSIWYVPKTKSLLVLNAGNEGIIQSITITVIIIQVPPFPSIPYVNRTSKWGSSLFSQQGWRRWAPRKGHILWPIQGIFQMDGLYMFILQRKTY